MATKDYILYTVIIEIGLTYKHTLIVRRPHHQDLSVNILLSHPHSDDGGRNFPFIHNMKYLMYFIYAYI